MGPLFCASLPPPALRMAIESLRQRPHNKSQLTRQEDLIIIALCKQSNQSAFLKGGTEFERGAPPLAVKNMLMWEYERGGGGEEAEKSPFWGCSGCCRPPRRKKYGEMKMFSFHFLSRPPPPSSFPFAGHFYELLWAAASFPHSPFTHSGQKKGGRDPPP